MVITPVFEVMPLVYRYPGFESLHDLFFFFFFVFAFLFSYALYLTWPAMLIRLEENIMNAHGFHYVAVLDFTSICSFPFSFRG